MHRSISEIDKADWNRLAGTCYPFMRHEFLLALEQNKCTGKTYGWLPRHMAVYEGGNIAGVLPLYEKDNSYGEFVFDSSWADAYHRHGIPYYPKWVVAAPYTPATGPRILVDPDRDWQEVSTCLVENVLSTRKTSEPSSIHFLFTTEKESALLEQHGFLRRTGCQFHWHNHEYRDFQDFLATFTAKKRKNVKQERGYASQTGVEIDIIRGENATDEQLQYAHHFYRKTFDEKWGTATLSPGFFMQIAETMGEQLLLIMARRNGQYVAGAIFFLGDDTLYGRHWGCIETHSHLYFELCFYQGIDYCIRHKLKRFEPGAQGEHKISRGFLPTPTWSVHWIRHPEFRQAIKHFLQHETEGMTHYLAEKHSHSPYKLQTPREPVRE
ncbi:MAG TPA: N-acetyltransferase [Gammaproteobacteria bacterium]|nr:N-acetyltransferase [Gammaproteobacteria bacterium]